MQNRNEDKNTPGNHFRTHNVRSWRDINVFTNDGDGDFQRLIDSNKKAKVMRHWRDTRTMLKGYSFFPMRVVNTVEDFGNDRVIHELTLAWYYFDTKRQAVEHILDPITITKLSRSLAGHEPIAASPADTMWWCFVSNCEVDYAGIDDAATFNSIRFKAR